MFSHGLPFVHVYVQILSYKDIGHIGLGSTFTQYDLELTNDVCEDPIYK